MPELSPEAKSKFEKWHLRQRELGACRCKECRDALPVKPTQAPATLTFRPFEELAGREADNPFLRFDRDAVKPSIEHTPPQWTDAEKAEYYRKLEVGPPPPEPEEVARVRRDKDRALASKLCLDERNRLEAEWRHHEMLRQVATAKELVTGPAVPIGHLIEKARAAHAERAQTAMDAWEAKKKLAMGGDGYLPDIEQKARLTYEQARANLEREFGAEAVDRSIAALEKLLTFRKDFDSLAAYADEAQEEIETARNSVAELDDHVSLIRDKLGRMKEALDE